MENTLYVALSKQMVLRRNMDVIANNVANASTPGFKGEHMMFVEHLANAGKRQKLSFVQDIGIARDFSAGNISRTGNSLDLAIRGRGWFVIETPQGERYTRNGRFSMDQDGQLVTGHGHPVLDRGGRKIVFGPADSRIEVSGNGSIKTESGEWQLRLVEFDNEQALRKVSGGLFRASVEPREAEDARVAQGMIEGSNVEPIIEVTQMIHTLREYQAAQKLIETEHERQRRAIDTIADQG